MKFNFELDSNFKTFINKLHKFKTEAKRVSKGSNTHAEESRNEILTWLSNMETKEQIILMSFKDRTVIETILKLISLSEGNFSRSFCFCGEKIKILRNSKNLQNLKLIKKICIVDCDCFYDTLSFDKICFDFNETVKEFQELTGSLFLLDPCRLVKKELIFPEWFNMEDFTINEFISAIIEINIGVKFYLEKFKIKFKSLLDFRKNIIENFQKNDEIFQFYSKRNIEEVFNKNDYDMVLKREEMRILIQNTLKENRLKSYFSKDSSKENFELFTNSNQNINCEEKQLEEQILSEVFVIFKENWVKSILYQPILKSEIITAFFSLMRNFLIEKFEEVGGNSDNLMIIDKEPLKVNEIQNIVDISSSTESFESNKIQENLNIVSKKKCDFYSSIHRSLTNFTEKIDYFNSNIKEIKIFLITTLENFVQNTLEMSIN